MDLKIHREELVSEWGLYGNLISYSSSSLFYYESNDHGVLAAVGDLIPTLFPRSYLTLTSLVSSNRVAVSMVIFLHSQTETPAIGHTPTALLYADLKPFIFPSRYIGYWQSLLSPLCPWTGAKADARKDLWTEWCDLCLSSSCYTVSLSVYFSVDSNEELVGQCSNLDFWVCGQSMSIFCSSPLFSQMLVLCFPTG